MLRIKLVLSLFNRLLKALRQPSQQNFLSSRPTILSWHSKQFFMAYKIKLASIDGAWDKLQKQIKCSIFFNYNRLQTHTVESKRILREFIPEQFAHLLR